MTLRCFTGYFLTLSACSTIAFSSFCSAPPPADTIVQIAETKSQPAVHHLKTRTRASAHIMVQGFMVKARRVAENAEIIPRFTRAL